MDLGAALSWRDAVRDELPPGTLRRLEHTDGGILIVPEVIGHDEAADA